VVAADAPASKGATPRTSPGKPSAAPKFIDSLGLPNKYNAADQTATCTFDKKSAAIVPRVPVGDNGSLMHAHCEAPGPIKSSFWGCAGATCGWTYGCTPATCGGHNTTEVNGKTLDWWAWTNDGNNSSYTVYMVY
jgi:hypothetical protein